MYTKAYALWAASHCLHESSTAREAVSRACFGTIHQLVNILVLKCEFSLKQIKPNDTVSCNVVAKNIIDTGTNNVVSNMGCRMHYHMSNVLHV